MRINNPRSLICGNDVADINYQLVTQKTLNTTSGVLHTNLVNTSGYLNDRITTEIDALRLEKDNNFRGLDSSGNPIHSIGSYGYAWLNENGKIEPSLIPSLAISETYVIKDRTQLFQGNIPDEYLTGQNQKLVLDQFQTYLGLSTTSKPQKGDIYVVIPEDGVQPNPNIDGTYIVVQEPRENENDTTRDAFYHVERLSYNDNGGIVKVNEIGLDPNGTPGEVTLHLSDILKTKYYVNAEASSEAQEFIGDINDARKLESTVFRMRTTSDGPNGSYRFSFIDNSGVNGAAVPIPYAQLRELESVSAYLDTKIDTEITNEHNYASEQVERLDNLISTLRTDLTTETTTRSEDDAYISGQLSSLYTYVGEKGSTRCGIDDGEGNITSRVNQLRYEIDKRTTALSGVNDNVIDLASKFNQLADNTVLLKYEEIQWTAAMSSLLPDGNVEWKTIYAPTYENSTYTGALYPERILAVYDENQNIIYPDIELNLDNNSVKNGQSTISAITENSSTTSLLGSKWTLLIAEPIKRINANVQLEQIGNLGTLIQAKSL